ncbi:hypothetical protein [Nocardioides marmoraquaticus]
MRLPVPDPRVLLQLPERLLGRVGDLLDAAEGVVSRVDALVDRVEGTRQRVDDVVDAVAPVVARTTLLLDRLQPSLEALAEHTSPGAVAVMGDAVDRVPELLRRFEEEVLPVARTLRSVAPDISELLQASHELNEMLGGVPGMKRIRQRVEDERDDG